MIGNAKQGSAEPEADTGRFSSVAGIAFALSPLYGAVAFPPVLGMFLLNHTLGVPFFAGAALGVVVPIAFRVWQSRDHARRAIKFIVIASPLTYAALFILYDRIPWVRGSPMAVLDVGLAIIGAAGLALAITWSYAIGDDVLFVRH